MLKKYLLTIILIISSVYYVFPADNYFLKKNNIQFETRLHYGFLLSHHLELERFNSHFGALEFSLQKATYGAHRWEKEYGFPLIGISFWMSNIGGFEEIGNGYALFPYLNLPLFKKDKSSLNFRVGLGLGYLGNKFDNKINYKNFAIGSHLNVAANLLLEYKRQISKRFFLSGGITLSHFSNGTTKTPNYGLNILTANISFAYYLNKPNPYLSNMILPELYPFEFDGRKFLELHLSFAFTNKDMTQSVGDRFWVFAIYGNLMKRVSYKSKFGLGMSLTADMSDKFVVEHFDTQESYSSASFLKTGISVAYELMISRMSLLFNLGIYVSGDYRRYSDVYQRVTLRYAIKQNLYANAVLNSHMGIADYIGIGLGYKIDFIYKRDIKH